MSLRFCGSMLLVYGFLLSLVPVGALAGQSVSEDGVRALVFERPSVDALRKLGPDVLPVLAHIYAASEPAAKAQVAQVFYSLGWQSNEAKRVLMADVHTLDRALRLQVQWALGRVSDDDDVVDVLLENMVNDANPLFRDKAACALASDQIHLTDKQKVRLYAGVIAALADSKPQVRDIAIKVLQIQTGQTKGFQPHASEKERSEAIDRWRKWLEEYRSQL